MTDEPQAGLHDRINRFQIAAVEEIFVTQRQYDLGSVGDSAERVIPSDAERVPDEVLVLLGARGDAVRYGRFVSVYFVCEVVSFSKGNKNPRRFCPARPG